MSTKNKIQIAILCPLRLEFDAVRQHLINPSSHYEEAINLNYEYGQIQAGDKEWSVALFEVGKGVGNMQMNASSVLLTFKPTYIFLIGIAGGIKDVSIGDVVVAQKAYGYESGKETKEGFRSRPEVALTDRKLLSLVQALARNYVREREDHQVLLGPIASGAKVLTDLDSQTIQHIREAYNDTLAVEMEAIGFYRATTERAVSALNIRGISDLIDNKADTETDGSRPLAINRAVDFFLFVLSHLQDSSVAKIVNPAKKVKVRFRRVPYDNWLRFSKVSKGALLFYKGKVELEVEGKKIDLASLKSVERFTMPGDFSPNWVKIVYENKGREEMVFVSVGSLPGLGSMFGGGKDLYADLLAYLEPIATT